MTWRSRVAGRRLALVAGQEEPMADSAMVHRVVTRRLVLVARDAGFEITVRGDEEGTPIGHAALVAMEEPGPTY
jgi:hypothetical protein